MWWNEVGVHQQFGDIDGNEDVIKNIAEYGDDMVGIWIYDIDDCNPSFKLEIERVLDIDSISEEKLDVNNNSNTSIESEETDKKNTTCST